MMHFCVVVPWNGLNLEHGLAQQQLDASSRAITLGACQMLKNGGLNVILLLEIQAQHGGGKGKTEIECSDELAWQIGDSEVTLQYCNSPVPASLSKVSGLHSICCLSE